jgi:hypothetical protein
MDSTKMLNGKGFYLLAAICSLIILSSSLEAALKIKDSVLFNEWVRTSNLGGSPKDSLFSIYVSAMLTAYMFKLISPTVISITALLILNKRGKFGIIAYIWVVMSVGGLAFQAIEKDFDSIFYYIGIILYIMLVLSIYVLALKRNYNAAEGGE